MGWRRSTSKTTWAYLDEFPPEYFKNIKYTEEILPPNQQNETYELLIGNPGLDESNFYNWYQSPEDIQSIKDYLSPYKIITMQLHCRYPLYVDFDLEVDIVKYDLTQPKKKYQ
jgi:hypothetical protein